MYNPFDKIIGSDLDESDLNGLIRNKVSEGFFVEYKESFPSTAKIANGIAALANTYGGWFIVGVKANELSEATEICGFDPVKCADPASLIRNSCRDCLDPYPVFRHSVVKLKSGRHVSVTWVPPSDETPHIAKDGRVYVRKGDAKEPVKVETKYQLEVVSERGKKAVEEFARFSEIDDAVVNSDAPAIQISLSPRPATEFEGPIYWTSTDFDKLKMIVERQLPTDLFEDIEGVTATTNIPFTNFYRSGGRIVIEQGDPSRNIANLTIELDGRGRCRILLPLPTRTPFQLLKEENSSSDLVEFLSNLDPSQSFPMMYSSPNVLNALMYLCRLYLCLLGEERAPGGFRYVVEAINMGGCMSYADDKEWFDHVKKFGMPVTKKNTIRVPFHDASSIVVSDDSDLIDNVRYTVMSILGLPVNISISTFMSAMMAYGQSTAA